MGGVKLWKWSNPTRWRAHSPRRSCSRQPRRQTRPTEGGTRPSWRDSPCTPGCTCTPTTERAWRNSAATERARRSRWKGSALPDGLLAYRLKRPLPGGRAVLVLQPTELLRRLATLVPPPRRHLVRYHGVFGPNSAWRAEIVPRPPQREQLLDRPSPRPPCGRRRGEVLLRKDPALRGRHAFRGASCFCASSARTCSIAPAAAAVWCWPSSATRRW
jgi:hypothetical protein